MNKVYRRLFLISALLFSFLFSCKKEKDDLINPPASDATVSGKIQKGPFKNESDVVIYELNNNLEQTGVSYSTTIKEDGGQFSFTNINISTPNVMVTATGYYWMEHYNLFSNYKLYLEAISDWQNGSTINVNLLTHLIKPRIEKLVIAGSSFNSARTQAQNELKTFLHVPVSDSTNFEKLDIANSNLLFAASLLFQKRSTRFDVSYNYTNWLNDLLIRFRSDFTDNGLIDSQDIIDTLVYNANRIELIDTKASLENYLDSLGFTTSLTDYEQYIYAFQKAYSNHFYQNTFFPDSAIWDIENTAPRNKVNILHDTAAHFPLSGTLQNQCIMSAAVPFDTSLVIKVTKLTPDSSTSGMSYNTFFHYGWSISSIPNGFRLEAQRKNYLNGVLVYFWGLGGADSARVDYYLNNQPSPYFSKIIHW